MKYKEIVDDIQVQFKSHNESIKTQNPYWILFRVLSEMNAIRDELLQKVPDKSLVPEWMIFTSPPITASLTNSGGITGVFDNFKFSEFVLPATYQIFDSRGVINVLTTLRQRSVIIETPQIIMLKIRAEDDSLHYYHYGFIENGKMYVYPHVNQIYIRYIPFVFCGNFDMVTITSVIPAPDFVIMEARKRVIESVMIQKQLPEDDKPDGRDLAAVTQQTR